MTTFENHCPGSYTEGEVVNQRLVRKGANLRYRDGDAICPVCGKEVPLTGNHAVPVETVPLHEADIPWQAAPRDMSLA